MVVILIKDTRDDWKSSPKKSSELTDGVKKKENFNLLHEGFAKPGTPPTVDIGVLCLRG